MTTLQKVIIGLGSVILLVVGAVLYPVPEDPRAGHDHDPDFAYYTCPMHPSMKLQDPKAPCPICGMDLTAVPKAEAQITEAEGPGFVTLTGSQQQLIGVTVDSVREHETASEIRTTGRITYDETAWADVNLKVSGWIRELYVDYVGKPVRKGEPLFTLYSPDLLSSQDEYLLAYRGRRSTSDATGWNERLLASARERLQLWDLTDEQIAEIEHTGRRQTAVIVYAPIDGVVIDRMAVAGMHVTPAMRLYRIGKLDTVWVKADVHEQDVSSVTEGQAVTVTLPYLQDRSVEGTVDYVYPYLSPKTRTGTIRIKVANPEGVLKPEMFADVDIHGTSRRMLIVPEPAVMFSGLRRLVFTALGEGRFAPKEVRLGKRFDSGYEILAGLHAGEQVVTSANFLLDSESKLKNVGADKHDH